MPTKIILLLVATIGLNGCCFMQLREVDHMTELQQSGDFKQLAKMSRRARSLQITIFGCLGCLLMPV